MDALWQQWWRLGGIFGIGWVLLFFIGGFALQGDSPSRTDSIESIRQYFTDDGDIYLAGDYLLGIAFIFFFLPFVVTLRWVLGSGEGWPPIWSWLSVVGGVIATIWGGIAGVFWGALAVGAAKNPEVEDTSVRTLMELDIYAFSGLGLPVALFIGAASIVILRTGVMWRWLAALGLISAVLMIIGAAWPIDGDEEGAIAIPGFIGFIGAALWILISSINLLMRTQEPAPTERAAA